jgi:hypothetical protein
MPPAALTQASRRWWRHEALQFGSAPPACWLRNDIQAVVEKDGCVYHVLAPACVHTWLTRQVAGVAVCPSVQWQTCLQLQGNAFLRILVHPSH